LTGSLAVLCVAWVLWPTHHTALEAGPVSTWHAMFNQDCGKCHTETFATATRLAPGQTGVHSTPDHACMQCHPAPDHNPCVKADNCASCHKEHRGDALLARPGDRHCTMCHAQLKEKYGTPCRQFENVASFAAHPEFLLWRGKDATDPGNVEFSHEKHLRLRLEDNLEAIAPAVRKLREMECSYCHQQDAAGKYMAAVQFDKHCQDCHPLQLLNNTDKVPEPLKRTFLAFLKEPVPHPQKGQTAWHVRAAARERYLQFAQGNATVLKLPSVPPKEWMVLPGLPRRGEPATQSQIEWVNEQWKLAESLWFDKRAGCAHCHAEVSKKNSRPDGLPDFGKPRIPQRWLEHSVFDHRAHRLLTCTSCHEGALTSDNRKDVLIPKLASCQSCHQATPGFARADCVECHQFHHRAEPAAWKATMTIQDCTGK